MTKLRPEIDQTQINLTHCIAAILDRPGIQLVCQYSGWLWHMLLVSLLIPPRPKEPTPLTHETNKN